MINFAIVLEESGIPEELFLEIKSIPQVDQVFVVSDLLSLNKLLHNTKIDLILTEWPDDVRLKWIMQTKKTYKGIKFIFKCSHKSGQIHENIKKYIKIASGFIFSEMSPFWSRKFIEQVITDILEEGVLDIIAEQIKGKVIIEGSNGTFFLNPDDILFVEKVEKQVVYHTRDKEYCSTATLNDLEEKLPGYFFRSHRSYLINTKKVSSIVSTGSKSFKVGFLKSRKEALLSYRSKQELMEIWKHQI